LDNWGERENSIGRGFCIRVSGLGFSGGGN